jgi:hypothetical protein
MMMVKLLMLRIRFKVKSITSLMKIRCLLLSGFLHFSESFSRFHSKTIIRMAASVAGDVELGPEVTASCFCGAIVIDVHGPPSIGRSFCHCSICRKLSGSPFSCNGLWPSSAISVMKGSGAMHSLATSKRVERMRCKECGGPAIANLMGGKVIALPLSSFSAEQLRKDDWAPQHHLHYGSRVVDFNDSLPKYAGAANGPLWNDAGDTAKLAAKK